MMDKEPTEFAVTIEDIKDLVDIATDGNTREFSKTIDWIGKVRKNPVTVVRHNKRVTNVAIPWKGYDAGYIAGVNHVLEAIDECLVDCKYLDDKINGEGCVGKWEGEKNCNKCNRKEIDVDMLKSTLDLIREDLTKVGADK